MFKRSDRLVSKPNAAVPAAAPAGLVVPGKQAPGNQAPGKQTPGKQAYEARRAAKAGVSLDRWMADKQKRAQAEIEAARLARIKAEPAKRGFFKRLLDRAHKPL